MLLTWFSAACRDVWNRIKASRQAVLAVSKPLLWNVCQAGWAGLDRTEDMGHTTRPNVSLKAAVYSRVLTPWSRGSTDPVSGTEVKMNAVSFCAAPREAWGPPAGLPLQARNRWAEPARIRNRLTTMLHGGSTDPLRVPQHAAAVTADWMWLQMTGSR